MTTEEAIKAIQIHLAYSPMYSMPKTREALEMAIAALREQEERSKGCEHCLSKINKDMMLAHGFAHCTDCGRRLEEV